MIWEELVFYKATETSDALNSSIPGALEYLFSCDGQKTKRQTTELNPTETLVDERRLKDKDVVRYQIPWYQNPECATHVKIDGETYRIKDMEAVTSRWHILELVRW